MVPCRRDLQGQSGLSEDEEGRLVSISPCDAKDSVAGTKSLTGLLTDEANKLALMGRGSGGGGPGADVSPALATAGPIANIHLSGGRAVETPGSTHDDCDDFLATMQRTLRMAKRFPIPEFDHDELKSRDWTAPELLDPSAATRLVEAAGRGDESAYGVYPVAASEAFLDALRVRGDHHHTLLCVMPATGVRVVGRSYAWKIQRAVAVLDVDGPPRELLIDWKTPRPMNTRLGPQDGILSPAAAMYLALVHKYSDHWVANRTIADNEWRGASGNGFRVLSCDNDEIDDFHASVISFDWDDA